MPRKTFQALDELLDTELNTYLMDQAVQTYSTKAARDTALPTPTEGQLTYVNDLNQFQGSHGGTEWFPVAGQLPYIELTKTASQNFTSGSTTTVTWATPTINRGGFTVSSNEITVPHAGLYEINAAVYWASNATGVRMVKIMLDGSDLTRDACQPPGALSFTNRSSSFVYLEAGQLIKLDAYQTATSATLAALADLTKLQIRYVCP